MSLSSYYQKYASKSDGEMRRRANVKEEELRRVFAASHFVPAHDPVRVAVMGCGERRLVAHHKRIFESLLDAPR